MAKINIPVDNMRLELEEIKTRQKQRKSNNKSKPTNNDIYEMLIDVLENQARIENMLKLLI